MSIDMLHVVFTGSSSYGCGDGRAGEALLEMSHTSINSSGGTCCEIIRWTSAQHCHISLATIVDLRYSGNGKYGAFGAPLRSSSLLPTLSARGMLPRGSFCPCVRNSLCAGFYACLRVFPVEQQLLWGFPRREELPNCCCCFLFDECFDLL